MIRTTIIAGGLLGLGVFTAAPAMAAPPSTVNCSPPAICANAAATAPVPGLVTYYTGTGPGTAAGDFTTAWTQGPGQAVTAWATGPATVAKVWSDALVGPAPAPTTP
jgi:hypothetical protein